MAIVHTLWYFKRCQTFVSMYIFLKWEVILILLLRFKNEHCEKQILFIMSLLKCDTFHAFKSIMFVWQQQKICFPKYYIFLGPFHYAYFSYMCSNNGDIKRDIPSWHVELYHHIYAILIASFHYLFWAYF